MVNMEERAKLHSKGLEKVLIEKEKRTVQSVVKYFDNTFTNDNIVGKDEKFWVNAYDNLLSGLFDVFAYQKHVHPELQVVHDIPQYLTEVYRKKNTDYGDSFTESMKEFGLYASVVRISDKIKRLHQLTILTDKQEVNDERVEDTVLDAINYTQMTLTHLLTKDDK